MKTSNQRTVYGKTLLEVGVADPRVVVLEADLGNSTQSIHFQRAYPERYFEMGIAEANMTSFAAGLSLTGKIPVTNSFAVFAAVMLANFIATSISYKKQEIGILRAIGSRGADVFRIFFSESLIIAGINFVLSCLGVAVATAIINNVIRTELNVLITVLHFGVRQAGLLLILSLAIAALASFFPVKRIASKKPIDAIRNR